MKLITQLIVLTIAVCLGCDGKQTATQQSARTTPAPTTASTQSGSDKMAHEWSFKDAPDTAVISLTRIMDSSHAVLYVVHDEDGDWQFLDGGDVSEEDAATVSLKNIVEYDPSINSLADLPRGWAAERSAVDQEWKRFQK